ncbi:hypothetical protein [Dethiobacter alkaliphilus]|uniref:hypothetical protein n=1 Tax=Dethiobacter alkaliphilus TaxID=427926 RepID=UPI0022279C19|nr:hypothetical protein [Dethiobacter alkaliphilus]MCW3490855.1 hypothetical protein [Dethiobacter alkaliphilus]
MDRRRDIPDVLTKHIADAVDVGEQNGLTVQISTTAPPKHREPGPLRVIRQRFDNERDVLELTVAAEDWGKEV